MAPETMHALIARLRAIESDVRSLEVVIGEEQLAANDQKYVSRCFELLRIELGALRDYIGGIPDTTR